MRSGIRRAGLWAALWALLAGPGPASADRRTPAAASETARVAEATPAPSAGDAVAAATVSPAIAQMVARVQQRVSELRGLPSKKQISYQPLGPTQLREALREAIDEQMPPGLRPDMEFVLRRLKLLGPRQCLDEIFVNLFSEQVAGLYDEKRGQLYVVTSFDLKTSLAEVILAHEICHALQDQNYDLSQWPLRETHNDDAAYGALSVLEGDATLLMSEYAALEVKPGRWLRELPGMLLMLGVQQPQLQAAPYFLQQQMLFPYMYGARFVEYAAARNARDRVLSQRPRSTEQILHPEKYFADPPDDPTTFSLAGLDAAAPAGWERKYHNTMGEMGTRILLEAHFAPEAYAAAAGWSGDVLALYAPADAPTSHAAYALVIQWRGDTQADAAEFERAVRRVAAERLFQSPANTAPDGAARFSSPPSAALLQRHDHVVVYVDASGPAIAERFAQAAFLGGGRITDQIIPPKVLTP